MNWDALEKEVEQLAAKISKKPDIIVAVVRGGLIPARLLATKLSVKDMYSLTVKKVGGDRKVMSDILEDLKTKNILLVEDMLETGQSLINAKAYLESKGAYVKTACLYTMRQSEIVPDYSLGTVNEVPKFPWE